MTKWIGLSLAALAIVCVGCSSSDSGSATNATGTVKKKAIKIAMIAKSSNNPVFLSAKTGAEAAAKDLSTKYGLNVTIDWRTPPEENGEEQARRIAQAVTDNADAILISCSDAAKVTGAINDAVDKGVPVMTFDSDAPQSKRFAFYGADDAECGKMVMDNLATVMGGKGNFSILRGNQTAPNLQKRVQGVQDAAKQYPGMHFVSEVSHIETPQDASAAVTREMNAKPEINCWAMVGGWPLFAQSLLTLDPAKVKRVAVDALPPELAYVDKGIAPVLLAQPTYDWGYKSVGFIVDKVGLGKDVPTINKMDLIKVTKDNLGDWAVQLQKWGFTGIDPKYLAMAKNKK